MCILHAYMLCKGCRTFVGKENLHLKEHLRNGWRNGRVPLGATQSAVLETMANHVAGLSTQRQAAYCKPTSPTRNRPPMPSIAPQKTKFELYQVCSEYMKDGGKFNFAEQARRSVQLHCLMGG